MLQPDAADSREAAIQESPAQYPADVQRWYILAVFSLFSFNQCLVWFTFSSVSKDIVIEYYGDTNMDSSTLALLLNWGPIMGIAMFPIQVWITQRGITGFRHAVVLGAALVFGGTVIRAIPCFCSETFRQSFAATLFLHLGQILNAMAGPLCMGTESRLSCLWFRENERATSTAVAVTSNGIGTTVGFLLGPALASTAATVPNLLYVEIALAAVPFLCCLAYYPARPKLPPSAAAAAAAARAGSDGPDGMAREPFNTDVDKSESISFFQGLRMVVRDLHFCVLVLAAGILAGVNAAWQPLLVQVLSNTGFSGTTVGYLGFGNGLAGNIGCVLVGFLSDKLFRRRFKQTIIALVVLLALSVLWFTLMVPDAQGKSVLPWSLIGMGASLAIAGLAVSSTSPLLYELCAELTYPVPEGTSAGVLACLWNLFTLIVIFLSPIIPSAVINYIMLGTTCLVAVMVMSVRQVYKRPVDA